MMIVNLARADLRDEFAMADEAFALSPISARATLPSEEDYDAISQAFMETSRGRWFLGEYAKRNRNADTRMVLDAVARVEETIAAQKQPVPDSGLAEALAAIRGAVDEAQAAAAAAVANLALEESLAPIRKGARIIREISWRWREIGADGRICDLLDSQVSAIEGACGQIAAADAGDALSSAFDLIRTRIAGFDDDTAAPQAAEEAVPSASPVPRHEMSAAVVAMAQEVSATADPESATGTSVVPVETVFAKAEPLVVITEVADFATEVADFATDLATEAADLAAETADVNSEPADTAAEAADVMSEAAESGFEPADVSYEVVNAAVEAAAEVTPEAGEENSEAADAYDESLLDMVALEMAAPDPADFDDAIDAEIDAALPPPPDPIIAVERPEPIAAAAESPAPMAAAAQPPPMRPSLQPSLEPSLGSSLIARGIVRRPLVSDSDPLAPIRRMSQAEKIAFFS